MARNMADPFLIQPKNARPINATAAAMIAAACKRRSEKTERISENIEVIMPKNL